MKASCNINCHISKLGGTIYIVQNSHLVSLWFDHKSYLAHVPCLSSVAEYVTESSYHTFFSWIPGILNTIYPLSLLNGLCSSYICHVFIPATSPYCLTSASTDVILMTVSFLPCTTNMHVGFSLPKRHELFSSPTDAQSNRLFLLFTPINHYIIPHDSALCEVVKLMMLMTLFAYRTQRSEMWPILMQWSS